MRDHTPILAEEFNGLFRRGDPDSCPMDHFPDCADVKFVQSGFATRDGLDLYLNSNGLPHPGGNVLRIYDYKKLTHESLLVLDDQGNIYDTTSPTPYTPIMTIAGMTDFGFAGYAGRAYISPCNGETGLATEKIWVYLGEGAPARVIGAAPPTGLMTAANSGSAGFIEAGIHIFAVVFETDTGFLSTLGPINNDFPQVTAPGGQSVNLAGIPISAESSVVARRIIATKAIDPTLFTGDLKGYQFFFVPAGRIADNTTTTLTVSFFDSELLEDAGYLLDIFNNAPAGVGLTTYHGRMITWATEEDHSIVRLSFPGDPETFDKVDGILIIPLDGNPITAVHEFRDVLYVFKNTKTYAYTDNGDQPSTWPFQTIDNGLGSSVHGIATVLDSGGINIEFLLVFNFGGIWIFNGVFVKSEGEISWKIFDFWYNLTRTQFKTFQVLNDSITQQIYINIPYLNTILYGNYQNGLGRQAIRWSPWTFDISPRAIALIERTRLIIGANPVFP